MWARANQSSSLCIWASRPYGGTRRFKTKGPVSWSVSWPEAGEDEALTRVPSAVCDCAHGGRVVKKASIAGLFRSRVSQGQTWLTNPFSLEIDEWSVHRDALIHEATTELNPGLLVDPDSIGVLSLKLVVSQIRIYAIKSITISRLCALLEMMFSVPLTKTLYNQRRLNAPIHQHHFNRPSISWAMINSLRRKQCRAISPTTHFPNRD